MTHLMAEMNGTYDAAPGAPPASATPLSDVQRIFSDVTRYPIEILEADANIEEDLGIDSVKLGEIFAALRAKYDLPALADIRDRLDPDRLRTISGVAQIVAQFGHAGAGRAESGPATGAVVAADPGPDRATAAAANGASNAVAHASPEAILAEVTAVFASITRYPPEILEADANLEEDLGIDSVKLGEIFGALRERYGLPPMAELRERITADRMRTIAGITGVMAEFVGSRVGDVGSRAAAEQTAVPAAEPTSPPAPAVVDTPAPRRVSDSMPGLRVERRRPLEGKIALVTGSGHGLGREIARHLADLGAVTIVNSFHSREQGIQTVEDIKRAGGSAVHVWASVANEQQRNAMFDEIEQQFGGLDFFVHCSSNGTLASIDRITSEDWDKAFRTNVVGLHQSALRASRLMQRRGGGRIVSLSMTATDRVYPYAACQSTVKAAIETLTRYLAVELAPYDIRVNCVKAGAVYGNITDVWPDSATLTPKWEHQAPLGRMCRPSDVCALISALLSDDLEFMTGATIVLDGGHSIKF